MEEEGRPRKLQKLEHDGSTDSHAKAQDGPVTSDLNNGNKPAVEEEDQRHADSNAINDSLHPETAIIADDNVENRTENSTTQAAPMSKKQQKRLLKMQKWEEQKEERRKWRREKRAQLKQRKRERKQNGEEGEADVSKKRNQKSLLVPITLVIDCGWDDLMNDRERISLGSQVTRAYSDNSRAPYRTHLVISSFEKLLKERFDTVLAKTHENWKRVRFMQEDFVHAATQAKDWMRTPQGGQLAGALQGKEDTLPEEGEVVYLSSDSSETLTELKPYSTYIIGGLVDKNRHKGVCHKKATELGIKTAKLPIGEYLRMASRPVLATNHVLEIMLKWLELGDWGQAFMEVIPQRKGGVLKTADSKSEENADQEEEDTDNEGDYSDVEQTEQTEELEAQTGRETAAEVASKSEVD